MALSAATPIRISYHNGCHFNSVVDAQHPFVPLGPEMPQSYRRPSNPDVGGGAGRAVEREAEQKSLDAALLEEARQESAAVDAESQMVRAAEKESGEKDLEAQMVRTVQKESETRNLKNEILRQVMMDSAKEANSAQNMQNCYYDDDDDDAMLQFALQQSRMESLADMFKSIKIPPFQNQPQKKK